MRRGAATRALAKRVLVVRAAVRGANDVVVIAKAIAICCSDVRAC